MMTDEDRDRLDSIAAALWSICDQLMILNGICPECEGEIVDEPVPDSGGKGEAN